VNILFVAGAWTSRESLKESHNAYLFHSRAKPQVTGKPPFLSALFFRTGHVLWSRAGAECGGKAMILRGRSAALDEGANTRAT